MALTRPLLALLALLAVALPAGAWAKPAPTTPQIVVYRQGVSDPGGQTTAHERALGFSATHRYRHVLDGFSARLTGAQIADLRSDPDVTQIVPDRPVHAESVPLAGGETLPVGIKRIGAAQGGDVREASGVAIAEIDTGIDLSHPDLNAVAGTNCISPGSAPNDDNGHGTHVAGTMAARNNGSGVVGVAAGTKIYAVKVLDASGSGSTSSVICGLDWVAAKAAADDIRVVNMSLGGSGAPGTCASDPEHGAVCSVADAGVTVVVAAGNSGAPISAGSGSQVPAAYPEVLAVTAMADTDGLPGGLGGACQGVADDTLESFSNYAVSAADAAHTIAAPGGCVFSDWRGGGTATESGTSMASPHVAAAVALCIDENGVDGPCAGEAPADVIQTMRATAQRGATSANGFTGDPLHGGSSNYYGYLVRASVPPQATTGDATQIGDDGATLAGGISVGGRPAAWWWELGTSAGTYDVTTEPSNGTPATDPTPELGTATGLDPGTTYHYRMVVQVDGWQAHGDDETFTTTGTPPPPPPDTSIDSAPPALTTSQDLDVAFSGTPADNVVRYECRLDGASWTQCSSPFTRTDTADGNHTFDVRAIGAYNKADPTPASVAWTVDTTPPDTTIPGHPPDPTASTSASFGLASNEAKVSFACRLDGADWASCPPQVSFSGLALGTHTFEARATDKVGLTDPSPAVFTWTISQASTSTPAPSSTSPAETGTPAAGGNPLAPVVPAPGMPARATLEVGSPIRLDRQHRRIRLTLACTRAASCAGRLLLTRGGHRIGTVPVRLAAGAKTKRVLRIAAALERRIHRGSHSTIVLSLFSASFTELARSSVRLLT
jgi:subtilisin family serine protease